MDRRRFLGLGGCALCGLVAGCSTERGDETPTATPLPDNTVRVGPSEPGCPNVGGDGETWGMLLAPATEYNTTVDSAAEARTVASQLETNTSEDDLTQVEPRPERIAWGGSTINISERYGARDWYLFTSATSNEPAAVLVLSDERTRVISYVVGPC